jgi:hypothetical protein
VVAGYPGSFLHNPAMMRWAKGIFVVVTVAVVGLVAAGAVTAATPSAQWNAAVTAHYRESGQLLLERSNSFGIHRPRFLSLARRELERTGARPFHQLEPLCTARQAKEIDLQVEAARLGFGFVEQGCFQRTHIAALGVAAAGFKPHKLQVTFAAPLRVAAPARWPWMRQEWLQHVALALQGEAGLQVVDPTFFNAPLPEQVVLERLGATEKNSTVRLFEGPRYRRTDPLPWDPETTAWAL